MKTKISFGFLAKILAALLLLALPVTVHAQFIFTTNGDDSLTIQQYTGPGGAVVIPDTTNGLPITGIAEDAFQDWSNLTSVAIGTNVTTIGASAFDGCFGLTNITMPNTVTTIGNGAFLGCTNLTSVTISTNVTNIGAGAFAGCSSLASVTIPNSVTNIGDSAFAGCSSLTSVTIPNSVTNIGIHTFDSCTDLTSVTIGTNVTSIGQEAFWDCTSLANVIIPNSVTAIGANAFYSCTNLTSVTIPNRVAYIGIDAFYDCPSLTGVYFTGNVPVGAKGQFAYSGDYNATTYYLPGTSGWNYGIWGYPSNAPAAVLWNPQAITSDASFGVRTNKFGFNITCGTNLDIPNSYYGIQLARMIVVVEACTNLASPVWQPLQTNSFTNGSGPAYFSDPQWTNSPGRFYRFRSP